MGRWIVYKQGDEAQQCDLICSPARSLANPSGPLHKSPHFHAFKLNMLEDEIHVYLNNAWSREAAEEVLKNLRQAHGLRIGDLKHCVFDVLGLKSEVSRAEDAVVQRDETKLADQTTLAPHQHWAGISTSSHTSNSIMPAKYQETTLDAWKLNKAKRVGVWKSKPSAALGVSTAAP